MPNTNSFIEALSQIDVDATKALEVAGDFSLVTMALMAVVALYFAFKP